MKQTAYYVLGLLFTINLINYLDRQVLYSLLPLIKTDLQLSDRELGALASAFMIVYMCAAPFIGYWADRSTRKNWIAYGIGIWSVATFASGLARGYGQLFAARAAVGIGESGYGSVSPSFVAEHFTAEKRGRVLAFFSMAIPVGSALGYICGGWIGYHYGWRTAFMVVGLPGLLLACLAYRLRDPRRPSAASGKPLPRFRDYLSLYRIPSYVASTLAMAALTFALGGLAVWMPTFLNRYWGLNVAQAGTLFGGITVVAGLIGSLAGGWLGDRLLKVTGKAYFIVSGAGLILALPAGVIAILSSWYPLTLTALFVTEVLVFLNMGPLNGVIVNVTSAPMRSMAFAANIFVIHALGDALSPTLIGIVSDLWGLRLGLIGAMLFLGLAGLFCLWGARVVEQDTRRIAVEEDSLAEAAA
ncbi:MAG: MFS transporter [Elusimicrobiota bacterium]